MKLRSPGVIPGFLPLVLCPSCFYSAILQIWHVDLIELFHFIVALKFLIFVPVLAVELNSLPGWEENGGHRNKAELYSTPGRRGLLCRSHTLLIPACLL